MQRIGLALRLLSPVFANEFWKAVEPTQRSRWEEHRFVGKRCSLIDQSLLGQPCPISLQGDDDDNRNDYSTDDGDSNLPIDPFFT